MADALEGLRVLDLSRAFAGTLVTQLLGDYGAEVIRVEPPGGDPFRAEPAFYLWHRNKKSVTLDLGGAAGREHARLLARESDVLVTDARPGAAERMGLGYESLAAENPGLLYCSITGFGRRGPFANRKGYEALVMAKVGALSHASFIAPRPGPAFTAVPYASFSAAQAALQGILAALHVRERSGRGQRIDTSLVQGIAAQDPWDWFLHLIAEKYPEAFSTSPPYSPRGVPTQSFSFRLLVCLTRDGRWLQFSQTSPHLFREFMEVLGLAWMWDDPEWSTAPEFDTEEKRERFWEKMLEAAGKKTLAEWQAVFEEHPNVWAEVFRTTRELLDHPQMGHNGHVLEQKDPRVGRYRTLAPMVAMSRTPGRVRLPAPEPGEHTTEVLTAIRTQNRGAAPAAGRLPSQPLEGITILDFGYFFAAPFGLAILADYGARVIKVEPLSGEPMRRILPWPDAGAVKSLQGKESVAVDIACPEGREIVHRIVRKADLVLMSYRAGVAEKLGVDYETLRAINPRLVYLNAPGYGKDGPCGRKPAYAPTIGAAAGAGRRQAGPAVRAEPGLSMDEVKRASIRIGQAASGPGQADGCAALGVATALLLGLAARERTGFGQEMLTSMLCTTAYALSEDAIEYEGRRGAADPDRDLYGLNALYRLYQASDGWIFLAAPKASEWEALCRALRKYVPIGTDLRFATASERARNDGDLSEALTCVFRERAAAEWEEELSAADVGCVEVAAPSMPRALMDDPVTREAGFLCEVEHPTFGRHRRLAPLAELSLTPGEARAASVLGQHTDAVLREIGYSDADIESLEGAGVIARAKL